MNSPDGMRNVLLSSDHFIYEPKACLKSNIITSVVDRDNHAPANKPGYNIVWLFEIRTCGHRKFNESILNVSLLQWTLADNA